MRQLPSAIIVFAAVLSVGLWLSACGAYEAEESGLSPAPPDTTVLLAYPVPKKPNSGYVTNGKDPSNTNKTEGQIDRFAWKTFIAMNWPAIPPGPTNKFTRGIPDTTKSIGPDVLTVWETLKEKREVFNHGTVSNGKFTPTDPGRWYSPVDYGPLRAATGELIKSEQLHPEGARVFHAATKQVFDALDETIEVKSEALEPKSPFLGQVVAPRVWLYDSATKTRRPVLYEVKVNYDFYKYVRGNGLWSDATADKITRNKDIATRNTGVHLPWRTSITGGHFNSKRSDPVKAPEMGSRQLKGDVVIGYSATKTAGTYATFQKDQAPPSEPPGIGSVHIKAAWIRLTAAEIKSKKFHTADAYYYTTVPDSPKDTPPVARKATFGLIGLHIIQRVHFSDKAGDFKSPGGAFVFATWEHNSIENPGAGKKYQYANYYDPGMNGREGQGRFGPVYDVKRRPGAILAPTQAANLAYTGKDLVTGETGPSILPKDSVWTNYHLIGTQFAAVDTPKDVPFATPPSPAEKALGQNSYLANLVIETNHGLQNFRGLPPQLSAEALVPPYNDTTYFKPPIVPNVVGPTFNRNAKNTAFAGSTRNMGGCMGCHGVAQIQGFNFSFVLLGGNEGAKTDTETRFDLPLANVVTKENDESQ